MTPQQKARRIARKMALANLQASGYTREQARHLLHRPAADAQKRQENTTALLKRKIAAAWGIKRQERA